MTNPQNPITKKTRPFAHVVAGVSLTMLLAIFIIGVPAEQELRSQNAHLQEEISLIQKDLEAAVDETGKLRDDAATKAAELDELKTALESTEGFIQ